MAASFFKGLMENHAHSFGLFAPIVGLVVVAGAAASVVERDSHGIHCPDVAELCGFEEQLVGLTQSAPWREAAVVQVAGLVPHLLCVDWRGVLACHRQFHAEFRVALGGEAANQRSVALFLDLDKETLRVLLRELDFQNPVPVGVQWCVEEIVGHQSRTVAEIVLHDGHRAACWHGHTHRYGSLCRNSKGQQADN